MMKTRSITYVKILVRFYIWVLHIADFGSIFFLNVFPFLDFAAWTKHHNNGHTNDGYCRGYGYRQLNSNGAYVDISSGAYGKKQFNFFSFHIVIFSICIHRLYWVV